MSCLIGCINETGCAPPKQPVTGDNIAPYVKVFFGKNSDNPELTVGNNSSPQWNNSAIIKSFEFGSSNGAGSKIEIVDTQGGAFHKFFEKLNKCMEKTSQEHKMGMEWGWIIHNCDGSKNIIKSMMVFSTIVHIEVVFAEGKVKFIIHGSDIMQSVFSARHDEIEGTDDKRTPLKTAIRNLGINKEPKFTVDFARIEKNGTITEYGFEEGGFLGPSNVWDCDGQNKLATIQKWLEPFVTNRKKGIVPVWDCSSEFPKLILLEDPTLDCNESVGCERSIATYIVNGGKCSSVLSFTPQINWVAQFGKLAGATGNAGGAATGKTLKKTKDCNQQTKETGIAQSIPITRYAWDAYGPKQALVKTEYAQNKHDRANSGIGEITAELRIQGDPSPYYVNPILAKYKTVSIVVINPFHIEGTGNGGCGDWLASPACNEILSNKNWIISGVSHSIREGSYVTTLQVKLAGPGISVIEGEALGGPGSGGYVPTNTC